MSDRNKGRERLQYIEQMLNELQAIAEAERADMLAYLLQTALAECHDITRGRRQINLPLQRPKR